MSSQNTTPESNDNVAKKGIKRMDAVVTGVILSGIIASIYGVSKLREKEKTEETHNVPEIEPVKEIPKKSFWKRIFGKK
ncbi:MAG: hypothetical protein PHY14_02310 [Candidatus Gracilibacteria bacterium]|nr:hypothetical protein [Candidatus Gracilibacteria bacterium]